MDADGIWQARTMTLELLALSFRYPSVELAAAVVSGEWADAAQELSDVLGLALPAGLGDDVASHANGETITDAEAALHALRAEATRLLIGVPKPVLASSEGLWRAAEDGVDPLRFVNPHSVAVEAFMRSCGMGQPEGSNEPLDYIATELEFMQALCAVEAGISPLLDESLAVGDLPGGSAAGAYGLFMREHVFAWMPAFADAVRAEARLPFYRAAGQLLRAYLEA